MAPGALDSVATPDGSPSPDQSSPVPRATRARLPDFFLLGAAKTGTTSLHHYLRQHPALFLPAVKELDFFNADASRFPDALDQYLSYFGDAGERRSGDATPLYFRRPALVAARMRRLYGARTPRFLVLIRDPVRRAYSHYLHKVSQGTEPLSFEEALQAERDHCEEKRRAWKTYFTDGCYAERLTQWWDAFPRERFLVLRSQTLFHRPQTALRRIFYFLGVGPDVSIDTDARLNQTGERQSRLLGYVLSSLPSELSTVARRWTPEPVRLWVEQFVRRSVTETDSDRPTLAPDIEHRLRARYTPHVRRLASLLDEDLSDWLPS